MVALRPWLMLMLTLIPSTARSQTLANSLRELGDLLQIGQTVSVTDEAGHKVRGQIKDLSAGSFTLAVRVQGQPSQKTFGEGPLTARWRNDGIRNGTLIGLATGALALGIAESASCASSGCGDYTTSQWFFVSALVGGGLGSGIGALIDLAHPVKKLHIDYRRSDPSSPSVQVSPLLGKGTGLLVSLTF